MTEVATAAPPAEEQEAPDPYAVYAAYNLEQLSGMYVKLRDAKKVSDDAYAQKMKPVNDLMERLQGFMLLRLDEAGADSVKTGGGTVYKTIRKSASIGDGAVFREYVISNEQWELVDWKANPTQVADHIEKYQAPPPGVNYTTVTQVGIRRPTAPKK